MATDKSMANENLSSIRDKKLFVKNLTDDITHLELTNYFARFGSLNRSYVAYDPRTDEHKGYGFVIFDDVETTVKVLEIESHNINGITVKVSRNNSKDEHAYNFGKQSGNNAGMRAMNGKKEPGMNDVNDLMLNMQNMMSFMMNNPMVFNKNRELDELYQDMQKSSYMNNGEYNGEMDDFPQISLANMLDDNLFSDESYVDPTQNIQEQYISKYINGGTNGGEYAYNGVNNGVPLQRYQSKPYSQQQQQMNCNYEQNSPEEKSEDPTEPEVTSKFFKHHLEYQKQQQQKELEEQKKLQEHLLEQQKLHE